MKSFQKDCSIKFTFMDYNQFLNMVINHNDDAGTEGKDKQPHGIIFIDDSHGLFSKDQHLKLDVEDIDQVIATPDHSSAIVLYEKEDMYDDGKYHLIDLVRRQKQNIQVSDTWNVMLATHGNSRYIFYLNQENKFT